MSETKTKKSVLEYQKKYRANNAEKIQKYQQEYRAAHRGYYREYRKKYYEENTEKVKEQVKIRRRKQAQQRYAAYPEEKKELRRKYCREYYYRNKDKYAQGATRNYEGQKKYRETHREEILAYQKQYRERTKDKMYEYQAEYRAETRKITKMAQQVCPAFWFLLSLRKQNLDAFLMFFKKGRNVARLCYESCDAVKECDASKCEFCNATRGKEKCSVPHIFEFFNAKQKMKSFVSKTKNR